LHNSIYLARISLFNNCDPWPSYNQSLVRRGEILFAYDFLDIWDDNPNRMNENKKGKPYSFPDSFILIIGYMRIYFHLPYRQTEGLIKSAGKNLLPNYPSYSQICIRRRRRRRGVNQLDISIMRSDDDDDDIIIAIDSTGIKVTNRGLSGNKERNSILKRKVI